MEIDVSALERDQGTVVEQVFLFPASGFDYQGDHLQGPVAVRVRLTNNGRAIRAEVAARPTLACACDRCLEPVALAVEVSYVEEFLRPDQARAAGVDGESTDEGGIRKVVFRGDTVSLDEGFWQNLILALPMKHLCREDCRGLCPRCGQRRNRGGCTCVGDDVDPRLEALERLFREER